MKAYLTLLAVPLVMLGAMFAAARPWEGLPKTTIELGDFAFYEKTTGRAAINCRLIPKMPFPKSAEDYVNVISPMSALCEELAGGV